MSDNMAGSSHRGRRQVFALGLIAAVVVAGVVALVVGHSSHDSSAARSTATTIKVRAAPPSSASTSTTTSTTINPSAPTTTVEPKLTITKPIPVSALVTIPGGTMALNANEVSFTHVVQSGENLTFIANWYLQMGGEPALYAFNRATIGPNPDLIYPGDQLTITMAASDVPKVSPAWPALQKLEQTP